MDFSVYEVIRVACLSRSCYSKAISRVIFSILLRSSNHHIVDKKNETELEF